MKDHGRERAISLATAVCDELEKRLKELRSAKAQSIIAELVKTQQILNKKHLGIAAIRKTLGIAASLLARGQTNFVRMIWRFNQVYNAERQAAEHSRPTRYEMRLPEMAAPGTLRTESLYIHQPALVAAAGTAKD